MTVSIPIVHDSWNTYSTHDLEFTVEEKYITINIKGEKERSISVTKEEFIKFAQLIIPHDWQM